MDEMLVHVEASGDAQKASLDLKTRIKDRVGVTVTVMPHGTGGVERSQGKAVRIIDKRPKG